MFSLKFGFIRMPLVQLELCIGENLGSFTFQLFGFWHCGRAGNEVVDVQTS